MLICANSGPDLTVQTQPEFTMASYLKKKIKKQTKQKRTERLVYGQKSYTKTASASHIARACRRVLWASAHSSPQAAMASGTLDDFLLWRHTYRTVRLEQQHG